MTDRKCNAYHAKPRSMSPSAKIGVSKCNASHANSVPFKCLPDSVSMRNHCYADLVASNLNNHVYRTRAMSTLFAACCISWRFFVNLDTIAAEVVYLL